MKFAAALFASALIASPAFAAPPTGKLRAAIEDAVRSELLDATGAVFTHLDYDGGKTYCGYVHFKGSFGKHAFKVWIDPSTASLKPTVLGPDRLATVSLGPRKAEQLCPPPH